ncbi:sulfotransferase domain-containing protein [Lutimaribacter saemankumensis]|uniref:Sulfotransferase domain-containing protein n=1 Tax=Lutimaribacter saemankumensis TaxID=490829 RepID=A0A1G8R1A4_9RHOB|nr:sulfotransferase domain-containing protein [Lutimaribacter saemankumensis]SDJ10345.1 Sulfotransferase domain-containing protein [Lutimaribacter saemankumensis]
MKKPNFFLVGASKAGTTSLAQALNQHPAIFITDPKEPNFFNRFNETDQIPQSELNDYMKLFQTAGSKSVWGDASVSYLASRGAAKQINNFNPSSKILISLRNPMQRVRSLYEMYVRLGLNQSFDDVTKNDPWLVKQCLYYEQVKRYVDIFPRHQILILEFSNLNNQWDNTIKSVHNFLELEHIAQKKPIIRNTGGIPKHPAFNILTNRKLVKIAKRIIPKRLHAITDKKVKDLAFKKSVIPKKDALNLLELFLEDTNRLDSLLKTQFSRIWFT